MQQREAKLREAAAKNDLAQLNINKKYVDTVNSAKKHVFKLLNPQS